MSRKIIYILLAALMCLSSCSQREEVEMVIPFSLVLPATDELTYQRMPSAKQTLGDPGKAEMFRLPNYVYIFIMLEDGVDTWRIMEVMEENLTDADWQKTRYTGILKTEGDSIYRYKKQLRILLDNKGMHGRVCAIASAEQLTFNVPDLSTLIGQEWDDLLQLKIDISSSTIQENIQNIYSTPYNYIRTDNGKYYGSFSNTQSNAAYLDLLLYHIASKVDLQWSVALDKRINPDPSQAIRLTYLEVRNLLNTSCYAFRPMENTVTSLPNAGRNIQIISSPDQEGLWWEGRTYFYAIPFTVNGGNYFPLQLLMRTNGSAGSGYQLTLYQPVTPTDAFVPWIRGNITLTQPLTDGTFEKIGEE